MKFRKWLCFMSLTATLSLALGLFVVKVVRAASVDTVAATVTAAVYSVSLDNASVAFLTVAQGSSQSTTTTGVDDSTTATNDGSVAAKFNIKAGNSTSAGIGWTLAASAGNETYTMKFCTTNCDAGPTWNSVGIDPSYQTLAASIGITATQVFDLMVGTPTSTASTDEQAITITVQAVAP